MAREKYPDENFQSLYDVLARDKDGEKIAELLLSIMSDSSGRRGLLARLIEVEQQSSENRSGGRAVGSQRAILDMIRESGPLTTDEVMNKGEEYGYRSLRFKQHASTTLNKAVSSGYIGKVRGHRSLKFAAPKDAIQEALKTLGGKLPSECEASDILEISKLTGLGVETVDSLLTSWDVKGT